MYGENGNKNIAEAVKAKGLKVDHVFSHYEQLQPCVGEVCLSTKTRCPSMWIYFQA
jgi:hypothetical protein